MRNGSNQLLYSDFYSLYCFSFFFFLSINRFFHYQAETEWHFFFFCKVQSPRECADPSQSSIYPRYFTFLPVKTSTGKCCYLPGFWEAVTSTGCLLLQRRLHTTVLYALSVVPHSCCEAHAVMSNLDFGKRGINTKVRMMEGRRAFEWKIEGCHCKVVSLPPSFFQSWLLIFLTWNTAALKLSIVL